MCRSYLFTWVMQALDIFFNKYSKTKGMFFYGGISECICAFFVYLWSLIDWLVPSIQKNVRMHSRYSKNLCKNCNLMVFTHIVLSTIFSALVSALWFLYSAWLNLQPIGYKGNKSQIVCMCTRMCVFTCVCACLCISVGDCVWVFNMIVKIDRLSDRHCVASILILLYLKHWNVLAVQEQNIKCRMLFIPTQTDHLNRLGLIWAAIERQYTNLSCCGN